MASYLLNGYLPRARALTSPGRASIHIEAKRRRGELTRIRRHLATEARHQFSDGDVQSSRKGGVEPGKAFDVVMTNHDPAHFEQAAKAVGFTGFGHYPKSNFMHIDTGPARRWNEGGWFPKRNVATPNFPTEPKAETIKDIVLKPEVLTGAGGVLTGAGAISQGSGPVQYAFGIVLVLIVLAFIAFLITKAITRPKEV